MNEPESGPPVRGVSVVIRRRGQGPSAESRPPADGEPSPTVSGDDGQERRPWNILAVEDSPIHRRLLVRQLEHALGCRVLQADGVEAAVTILLDECPDLIITDLMMPDMDGVDLIGILQAQKEWRDIAIIIHSVINDVDRVQALTGSGIRDYILKPFNPVLALPRIKAILGRLSRSEVRSVPARPSIAEDRIPVVLASSRPGFVDLVRREVNPVYEVISAGGGPAVVTATLQARPWAVFLSPEPAAWDIQKTIRSVQALRTTGHVYVTVLPPSDTGDGALERMRQELDRPPFRVATDDVATTVRVEATFTPSCMGALRRTLGDAVSAGTERVILDVPSQGLGPQTVLAIRDLIRAFRTPAAH